MIPSIEDILTGMESGTYSREQALGWLHQHATPALDRPLFAAMAMQGMLAGSPGTRTTDPDNVHKHIAKAAVMLADALIEELGAERTGLRQGDQK